MRFSEERLEKWVPAVQNEDNLCLLRSCNDSPFEATWGEWLNSEVLCSEKIQRCHTDSQGEQPSRGWRTLNKVGRGRVSFVFPVTALTASSCTVSVLTELLSLLCPCRRGPHSSFTNKLAYMEKRLIQVYVSICVFLPLIPVESTSQDQAKGARITLLAASWNWHLGKKAQQRPPLREGITVSSHAR